MMTNNNTTTQYDFLQYALDHEFGDIHFRVDPRTGMKAIIAIHSTKLGPALGGCRFIPYPNTDAAIYDVLRLARGMSYKAALADLPLGGGKSVIIKPNTSFDRTEYFHAFGNFVHSLNGDYITALDSGTDLPDMDIVAEHTPYVASLSKQNGNPSPLTVDGVLKGIEAAVLFQLKKDDLRGLHVAIQGLGHVGYGVAERLHKQGVRLTVADISSSLIERAVRDFNARVVDTSEIHTVSCDVFSPCALGGIISDSTIDALQTSIIAGAANNQLAHTHHAQRLHDKGILYAPDYVINAGGLIYAAHCYLQTSRAMVEEKIAHIKTVLLDIFHQSKHTNQPTTTIADMIAERKLSQGV